MMARRILIAALLTVIWFGPVGTSAQDGDSRPAITSANATQVELVAMLGRGWINQLAWSPDGSTLAVAGSAGVWLHETSDLQAAPRFLETRADTWSMAFSSGGRLLATGGRDMSVRVWEMDALDHDIENAEPLYDLLCRVGEWWKPVESLAFNPAGTVLACATDGVMLWDMTTGEDLAVFMGETDFWGDTHVAFSPDGATLATTGMSGKTQATGGRTGVVRLWDVQTYERVASWQLTEGHPTGEYVAYSPDGALLAVAGKHVEVRETATGAVKYTLEDTSGARGLAFSPDGTVLVTVGYGITLWDVATGELLAEPAFDDGEFAYCFGTGEDQTAQPCPASYDVLSAAISPDGATLAVARSTGRITLWDVPSGEYLETLRGYTFGGGERGGASSDTISKGSFAFSPDGVLLAAGASGYATSGGWVELWDVEQQAVQGYLTGDGSMSALAYSPDGSHLVTASAFSGLRVWDTATQTVRHELMEYGDAVSDVAFSPDGTRIAAGLVYGTIRLWDAATGDAVADLEDFGDYMNSIAFSPDGTLLASGDADGLIRVWNVEDGALLGTLDTRSGWVGDVTFSPMPLPYDPDEMLLASAGGLEDGTVRLWAVQADGSARELAVLTSVPEAVTSVAFNPDGTVLASGHGDGNVRLWDATTGALLTTLEGHPRAPWVNVVFSHDSTLLATGGWDGTIRLWGVPTQP